MDLLEIRKKAREKKLAEEAAREADREGNVSETPPPDDAPAPPPEQAPEKPRPAKKRKKKAAPKRAPVVEPETGPEAGPGPDAEVAEQAAVPEAEEIAPPAPVKEAAVPAPSPAQTAGPEDELEQYLSDEGPAEEGIIEYLAFMLGKEEYAVKVEDVREIIRLQKMTNVPRAPEFVKGIISLRGVIIPVFDIKRRLGLEESVNTRTTRIIVVSDDGSPQGMMVDKVTGVARLKADGIEPTPAVIGGVEAEYLEGVGRIKDRLLILFNTARVLAMEGQAQQ